MDSLDAQVARAEEAQRLLNSPLFTAALQDTRTGIQEAWARTNTKDKETLQELHLMVKLVDRVENCLKQHIDSGKIAAHEIEGRKKRMFGLVR